MGIKKKYKAEIEKLNNLLRRYKNENDLLLDVISINIKNLKFKNTNADIRITKLLMDYDLRKLWEDPLT